MEIEGHEVDFHRIKGDRHRTSYMIEVKNPNGVKLSASFELSSRQMPTPGFCYNVFKQNIKNFAIDIEASVVSGANAVST